MNVALPAFCNVRYVKAALHSCLEDSGTRSTPLLNGLQVPSQISVNSHLTFAGTSSKLKFFKESFAFVSNFFRFGVAAESVPGCKSETQGYYEHRASNNSTLQIMQMLIQAIQQFQQLWPTRFPLSGQLLNSQLNSEAHEVKERAKKSC